MPRGVSVRKTGETTRAVHVYVRLFIREHGYAPSFTEIARAVGVAKVQTVSHHIAKLVADGKLRNPRRGTIALPLDEWRALVS